MEYRNRTLKNAVKQWLSLYPKAEQPRALSDLLSHGCQSGMVAGLIYYSDTAAFFDRFHREIAAIVSDLERETGEVIKTRDGETFAHAVAGDEYAKNWFAWLGFEETARLLADEVYHEK